MGPRKRTSTTRRRVGRVSLYLHHGAWWLYYRDGGNPVRRKIGQSHDDAEQVAAQVNSQLTSGAPSLLAFSPISVPELRQQFLFYHEKVLKSSMATVCRYRAATQHLVNYLMPQPKQVQAHEVHPNAFAAHLRGIEVAPNGHPHTKKRRLRDKGIQYILECCRAMYTFAAKQRHLPPYAGNPFAELPLDRLKVEDAKPIYVFNQASELAFFKAASPWEFGVHFTLAKTGLRIGELVHLLIEDIDLGTGWLHVRNKTVLGWRVKTGTERDVPLISEVVAVLERVINGRKAGPVFLRERFCARVSPPLVSDRKVLECVCEERQREGDGTHSRAERLHIARTVWRDAGAVNADRIRISFIRTMAMLGSPDATCPKSWRHSFATLLQDANVDPLIRQITLGHRPTASSSSLGMTAHYTHTRRDTQKNEIERALRLWPLSLKYANRWSQGGESC